jgi:two-component system OmpR family response regulator
VIDVLVSRLRRKVDKEGATPLIHTVRGRGYVLSDKDSIDGFKLKRCDD